MATKNNKRNLSFESPSFWLLPATYGSCLYVTLLTFSVFWCPTCLSNAWVNFVDLVWRAWLQRFFECFQSALAAGSLDGSDKDCTSAGVSYVRGLGTDFWAQKEANIPEKNENTLAGYTAILCYKYYWAGKTPVRRQLLSHKKQREEFCLKSCITFFCMKYILVE